MNTAVRIGVGLVVVLAVLFLLQPNEAAAQYPYYNSWGTVLRPPYYGLSHYGPNYYYGSPSYYYNYNPYPAYQYYWYDARSFNPNYNPWFNMRNVYLH